MKTTKFIILLLVFAAGISLTSCVEDGKFEIPNSLGTEENTALTKLQAEVTAGTLTEISIANLKGLLVSGQVTQITSNIYVKGYVTSSDQTGNFFKEFFIQDAPSNPTAAIKIVTEFVDSYNKFNVGREVYIRLKDLSIGEVRNGDGVTAIGGGEFSAGRLGTLTVKQTTANVFRASTSEEIIPIPVKFSGINNSHIGMFVIVANAQFPSSLVGKTYVDAADQFDTQRLLESCDGFGYTNFILETSAFAEFKFSVLPAGGGSVAGVVSKNFNGSNLVLALNKTTDVIMNGVRCTPLDANDFTPILEENFEAMPSTNPLGGNGWISFAETGRFNWRVLTSTDSGNPNSKIASMGAFRSLEASNIAWMISPAINLNAQDLEFLNFRTSNSFADESVLEVLISTNWDGDPAKITTATWQKLPASIVSRSENFQNWVDSGAIDLSGFSGTARIAFKYIGGDNAADSIDGTYEVDNFKILVRK
jgi:hypothetical protein